MEGQGSGHVYSGCERALTGAATSTPQHRDCSGQPVMVGAVMMWGPGRLAVARRTVSSSHAAPMPVCGPNAGMLHPAAARWECAHVLRFTKAWLQRWPGDTASC
jgi:hypothetical protein